MRHSGLKLIKAAIPLRMLVRLWILRLRQGWQSSLSLVTLYRYASDYGNSYWKPVAWLLGTVALFAVLYPVPGVGLARQGASQAETYTSTWRSSDSLTKNLNVEVQLVGKSAIASLDAVTFQKIQSMCPHTLVDEFLRSLRHC